MEYHSFCRGIDQMRAHWRPRGTSLVLGKKISSAFSTPSDSNVSSIERCLNFSRTTRSSQRVTKGVPRAHRNHRILRRPAACPIPPPPISILHSVTETRRYTSIQTGFRCVTKCVRRLSPVWTGLAFFPFGKQSWSPTAILILITREKETSCFSGLTVITLLEQDFKWENSSPKWNNCFHYLVSK